MTTAQLRSYKQANQKRKAAMARRNRKPVGVPVHSIQNGRYTK